MAATNTQYNNITDAEFLGLDEQARALWAEALALQAELDAYQAELDALGPEDIGLRINEDPEVAEKRAQDTARRQELAQLLSSGSANLAQLQGQAQVLETRRENRGATVTQQGVNAQTGSAAEEAIRGENLLLQNVQQELTGRISRNRQQAEEAKANVNLLSEAERGRQAARAGQAGYGAESGTLQAMAEASKTRSAGDQQAIDAYQLGMQNLLLGQSEGAATAAETLTGSVRQSSQDWETKSTTAVTSVTANLLSGVQQAAGADGFGGNVWDTAGLDAAAEAVGTTLDTWSLDNYMSVLDTLTSNSANRRTWDQMLMDLSGKPTNPYAQFDRDLAPLTPIAGVDSNLLAAAAGSPDNVYRNKTGRLI